jgi:hypothetical protein
VVAATLGAALTVGLVFSGALGAAAIEPPVIIATYTSPLPGPERVVKDPASSVVYSRRGVSAIAMLDTATNAASTIPVTGSGAAHELDIAGGRLYVTSSTGIDVIDTTTNTVVGFYPAPAGDAYRSLVVDPATGNLYVAGADSITVLAAADGSVVSTFASGVGITRQLSINPSTNRLYASTPGGAITAYDLGTVNLLATSAATNVIGDPNSNGLAVDTSGNRIIAVTSGGPTGSQIGVFDGDTLALLSEFPAAGSVWSIGYLPQSELVAVSYLGLNPPSLIDANTGTLTPVSVLSGINRGLYVDQATEYLYVAGTTNSMLRVLAVPADILTTTLPDTQPDAPYSQTIDIAGSLPTSFAVTTGSLPPGLTLDPATGAITGTATTPGIFTFTVTATNAAGADTQEYTIRVGEPPVITTLTLPDTTVDQSYTTPVEATGTAPITFAVTAGTLPDGLALDPSTGQLTGTPTTAGTYTFTVTATNALGSDTQEFTLTILDAAVTPPTDPTDPGTTSPGDPGTPEPTPSAGTGSPTATPADTDALATTGASFPWIASGVGLLLLSLGTGALLLRRHLNNSRA